jgi:hypothetical protein
LSVAREAGDSQLSVARFTGSHILRHSVPGVALYFTLGFMLSPASRALFLFHFLQIDSKTALSRYDILALWKMLKD